MLSAARAIVDEYVNYYSNYWIAGLSVTQSALDLSKVEELQMQIDKLALAMEQQLVAEHDKKTGRKFHDALLLAHWEAQSYNGEQFVDLFDFCDCLQKRVGADPIGEQCRKLQEFLKTEFVIKSCYCGADYQYSYGVSMYFPWSQVTPAYWNLDFVHDSERGWGSFLRTYTLLTRREPRGIAPKTKLGAALGDTIGARLMQVRMTTERMTTERMTAERMTAERMTAERMTAERMTVRAYGCETAAEPGSQHAKPAERFLSRRMRARQAQLSRRTGNSAPAELAMTRLRFTKRKAISRIGGLALAISLAACLATRISKANPSNAATRFNEATQLRSEQLEDSNRKAIQSYLEAANLWRDAGNSQQAATAFRSAGEVLNMLGESTEALLHYKEALVLAHRASDSLEQAKIQNDLAYLHFIEGNTKEAHRHCLKALEIGRRLQSREVEAAALSNLGEIFYSLGDLEKAQQSQQQSLAIWTELGNQRGQAIALSALGFYYVNLGEPGKALQAYSDSLSHAKAAQDLSVEGLAHLAIANFKRKLGEKQDALTSYEDARLLATRIGDQTSQAMVAGGIGAVWFELGDHLKALDYMQEATRLFEANGKKWGAAEGKLDLGRIHHALSHDEQALAYFAEALTLFKSLSMPRLEALTLREIGLVHLARGDAVSALDALQQALRLMHSDQDQRQVAYTLNHIGEAYERLKNVKQALAYYRRALPLSKVSADPESQALTHYNLAHVERDRGNLSEARKQIEAALQIVESQRTKVSSQDLRASYFATVRNTYELSIDVLMQSNKQNPEAGFDKQAFGISEKAHGRSFLELLRDANANVREGVDASLLFKERELNEAINTKAQHQLQLAAAKRNDEATLLGKEVDVLVSELAQLREQIRQSSPRFAALREPELLSLEDVQRRVLDDQTVLLEYVLGDDRSYVWLVTKNSCLSFELASRAEIEASAKRVYNLLTSYQMIYGESAKTRADRQAKVDAAMPAENAAAQ